MSIKTIQQNNISAKTLKKYGGGSAPGNPYVRDPSWPTLYTPSGSDQMLVGLYAIWPTGETNATYGYGNFFAALAQGNYNVTITGPGGSYSNIDTTSNTQINLDIDYNNSVFDGSNAPVTFTASTSTVNRTSHGYSNGMVVRFYNVVTTTGITASQMYYVINATDNTFQISSTLSGSAITLTNDGSATLLPYKIATVTITPQAGQNLTSIDIHRKHNKTGLPMYSTGWLDINLYGSNLSYYLISSSSGSLVVHGLLERCALMKCRSIGINDLTHIFSNCYNLKSVIISDDFKLTGSMSSMFQNCYSLKSVPLFNTGAVTNMSNMFFGCGALKSVPLFNTGAVTSMSNMFSGCGALKSVPLFNTGAVTTMTSMFQNCYSLTSVPLFNTSAVTSMSSMFSGCGALESVPLFNTGAVTNMSSMFQNCFSLQELPQFNLSAISSSAGLSNTVVNCRSLSRIRATGAKYTHSVTGCRLGPMALDEYYTGLPTVTGQTLTVTSNWGTANDTISIATAKGWTISG